MSSSSISYLWRDKDAPSGFRARFLAQSYQSIARDPGFPGQLWQSIPCDAPAHLAHGAQSRTESWGAHRLRRQLLDAAHDSQVGL